MSIKYFSECGKEVSSEAKVCPHCSKKLSKSFFITLLKVVMWAFIIFIVIGIVAGFVQKSEEDYQKAIASTAITKEQCEQMHTNLNGKIDKFMQINELSRDETGMIAMSNVMSDHENLEKFVKNINTVKLNIGFYNENCENITGKIDTSEFYESFPD
ncbi:MAG: hypothetical protein PHV08_05220 [Sulfurovaceae bacterium]|nr:hypothetical protein [Sulfurovaceae bacterium]